MIHIITFMQWKWPNFIPSRSWKRWEILKKDGLRLFEDCIVHDKHYSHENPRVKKKKSLARVTLLKENILNFIKETNTFPLHLIQTMNMEEIINNILNNPNLSQSYWNPSWYPPVPHYTPPQNKSGTYEQKRVLGVRNEKIANKASPCILFSENFWDAWVYTSSTPITTEEWEKYYVAGFPYTNPLNIFHHVVPVLGNEWIIDWYPYSERILVERVKWHVAYFCSESWNELIWVYCYRNRKAIEEIIAFLSDTTVINTSDNNQAILALNKLHLNIS